MNKESVSTYYKGIASVCYLIIVASLSFFFYSAFLSLNSTMMAKEILPTRRVPPNISFSNDETPYSTIVSSILNLFDYSYRPKHFLVERVGGIYPLTINFRNGRQEPAFLEVKTFPNGFIASGFANGKRGPFLVLYGRVDSPSLFKSMNKLGLERKVVYRLNRLFERRIDFRRDLRKGDAFSLILQKDIDKDRGYKILASKIKTSKNSLYAFYYQDKDGREDFFDEDGRSLTKTVLTMPLKSFRKITSPFSFKRLHPIFGVYLPHPAFDFSAPRGAPVIASGDGKIVFQGWKGGLGKAVEIRHNSLLTTSYGHLSRFSSKKKVGSSVRQGETIGYVGATGIATGPHLDFRLFRGGKPVNFLKEKDKLTVELAPELKKDFQDKKEVMLRKLKELTEIELSINSTREGRGNS